MAASPGRGNIPAIALRAREHLVGMGTAMPAAHRIVLFVAALIAIAVTIFALDLVGRPAPFYSIHLPWPLLAVGFCVVEMKVVSVHFQRETHAFSLSEFPAVIGMFFLPPTEYLLALLAFIRTAQYWTTVHPGLEIENDVRELMSSHKELA